MNFAVLQFPGSNCDQDVVHVLRNVLGHSAELLWHKEPSLGAADAVIVPGGFSYGDYLRTGAIARFSPVMEAVQGFAANGGLVLGICNGFQILCEAGLLPGALIRHRYAALCVECLVSLRAAPSSGLRRAKACDRRLRRELNSRLPRIGGWRRVLNHLMHSIMGQKTGRRKPCFCGGLGSVPKLTSIPANLFGPQFSA